MGYDRRSGESTEAYIDRIREEAANNQIPSGPGGSTLQRAIDQARGYGGGGGGGTSGGGGGAAAGGGGGGGTSALDEAYRRMLEALASGNRERFEFEREQFNRTFAEQQRQFNQQFGLNEAALTGLYNGNPTLAAQLQQAQLSGIYNGNPTESAREFNEQLRQRQQEFQGNLGTTLLNAATQIRGPRDYLQYQQFTRGGQNLMQQLFGEQPLTTGGQPTGQLESATLQSVLADLGLLPAAASAQEPFNGTVTAPTPALPPDAMTMGKMAGPGAGPGNSAAAVAANLGGVTRGVPQPPKPSGLPPGTVSTQQTGVFGQSMPPPVAPAAALPPGARTSVAGTPTSAPVPRQDPQADILARFGIAAGQDFLPHQINPARWDAMGRIGQDLVRNLAETRYGYDAGDFENMINATRPRGTAARMTRTSFGQPRGLY